MEAIATAAPAALRTLTSTPFIPRTTFPTLASLPRSYFLGHHASALAKMRTLLSQIDLVVECRDSRIPLSSRNPTLEQALGADADGSRIARIITYTKRDLVPPDSRRDDLLRRQHSSSKTPLSEDTPRGDTGVYFSTATKGDSPHAASATHASAVGLLRLLTRHARKQWSLTGTRVLVAGMPNVGKSTLLNALRARGVGRGKVAKTGADPGVTRRVGSAVRIVDGWEVDAEEGDRKDGGARVFGESRKERAGRAEDRQGRAQSEGVYMLDTPGVFMPYVSEQDAMLKLALCGSVKDGVVPPVTLADYLLFKLNLDRGARQVYARKFLEGEPTNDVGVLLDAVGRKTGRLVKGGHGARAKVDLEGTAMYFVRRWRKGELGKVCLDEVDEGALERDAERDESGEVSISQARKAQKEAQREKMRERGKAKGYL